MSVNSRCLVAQRAADLAFALTECERALAMWSDVLGPQHPEVALGMNNVGAVLERLGKHDAACQRFEDSLRIGEAALGGEHPQVAMTLGNLGECELARGHASLAVTIQTRVLRIREKLRDPRTSLTLNNLGRAYLGAGDTARAIEALEHAAALQTPETDLAERVETGFALAKAKWEQGDHRAARAQAITARTMLPEGLPEQRVIDDWLERHR
jgi:tetratricopeptide (TPR) repeat protein